MKTRNTIAVIVLSAVAAVLMFSTGCASQGNGDQTMVTTGGFFPHVKKSGGQIWAENCTRCHNARPSTQYSPQQWSIICAHMRIRADLNGEEQRAVQQFMSGT